MNASPAPNPNAPPAPPWRQRWQHFAVVSLKAFHAYASWLVSISWRRFILLAILLLVVVGILHDLPPFTWTFTEQIEERVPRTPTPPKPPKPAAAPATPAPPAAPAPPKAPEAATRPGQDLPIRIDRPRKGEKTEGLDISIGKDGIRITPRAGAAASAPPAASAPAASETPASAAGAKADADVGVHIALPPGATSEAVREAVEEARQQIEEATAVVDASDVVMAVGINCTDPAHLPELLTQLHQWDGCVAVIDISGQAADESVPNELKRALALGSANGYSLGARLSALAHDGTVPREAFEENYVAVRAIADQWEASQ